MSWLSPAPERDRFVDDLLGHMTLGEKIGQLDLFHPAGAADLEELIAQGLIGGVAGASDAERLQNLATKRSRLGIPLLLFDPAPHAVLSPWALAASWDEEMARLAGAAAAEAALQRGCNGTAGPCVAAPGGATPREAAHLATDDGYLAGRLSAAFLAGAADRETHGHRQVLAIPRWNEGPAEAELAWAGEVLENARPQAIDSASTDRQTALRAGFAGLLVAECRALHARLRERFATTSTRTMLEAAERAITDGDMSEHRIDAAVRAVLGVKHALGLFRQPDRFVGSDASAALALPVAAAMRRKAMVLLRNEAGLLPFSPVSDKVLVVGPTTGPARACAEALAKCSISFSAVPGLALRQPGESWQTAHPGDTLALSLTRDAAQRADFVMAVLDGRHFSDEPGTRFARPTPTTLALLRALASSRTRVAAVIATADPVDLADADPYFAAVLQSWDTGPGFEEALGDILSGRHAPQGRMPAAVGRYAFGQGSGFGDSAFMELRVTTHADGITASVRVRNSGNFPLRETVQLYLKSVRDGEHRLADFIDVTLAPGAEDTVTFELDHRHLATGPIGMREVHPGHYAIAVGKDRSRALRAEVEITPPLARSIARQAGGQLRLAAG